MGLDGGELLSVGGVPKPHRAADVAAGHQFPAGHLDWAYGQDPAAVTVERGELFAYGGMPEPHRAAAAAAGQQLPADHHDRAD